MSRRTRKSGATYDLIWTGVVKPEGRKGHRCRKIGKGTLPELVHVEFEDGKTFMVRRNCLQRA